MRTRAVGAVLVGALVAGCSGSGGASGRDDPSASASTASTAACDPAGSVSVTLGSAEPRPVLLAGEGISVPAGDGAGGTTTFELDDGDLPVEVVGASGPVDDDLRAAVGEAATESAADEQQLFSLDPVPATFDVLTDVTNLTDRQRRWAAYVVGYGLSASWTAEGCSDAPQRGEVRGWDGRPASGTIPCFAAKPSPRSPQPDDELVRLVTAEICRG